MLTINDLKIGTKIEYKNEPHEIIRAEHSKQARGGAILRTTLKNLASSAVLEAVFKGGDQFKEADLSESEAKFLYRDEENFYFMDNENFEQFNLTKAQLGSASNYLAEGTNVKIINFKNKPINIELPPKVDLKVISAPPGVKGNTTNGGTKEVILETGLRISVPLFIKEGNIIKISTKDGSYVERVS